MGTVKRTEPAQLRKALGTYELVSISAAAQVACTFVRNSPRTKLVLRSNLYESAESTLTRGSMYASETASTQGLPALELDPEELLAQVQLLRAAVEGSRRESRELVGALERERRLNLEMRQRFERQFAAVSDQLLQLNHLQKESEALLQSLQEQLNEAELQKNAAQRELACVQRQLSLARAEADAGKRVLTTIAEKEALLRKTSQANADLQQIVMHLQAELRNSELQPSTSNASEERLHEAEIPSLADRDAYQTLQQTIEKLSAERDMWYHECARAKEESLRLLQDAERLRGLLDEQQRVHTTTQTLLQDRHLLMRRIIAALAEKYLMEKLPNQHYTQEIDSSPFQARGGTSVQEAHKHERLRRARSF